MAEIRYIFGNLRTGVVQEEIALQGVSFSAKLSDWGSFQGTFALDQSGKSNTDLVDTTIPGFCYVAVEREGVPVWYGIIWTRTYQAQSKTMQITARTLEAYLEKVRVQGDYDWQNIEQRNIMRNIFNTMQGFAQTNLGIVVPGSFPDAVLKSLTLLKKDFKTYADAVSAIADGSDGFDWYISISKDGSGNYVKTLQIGYPTIGNTDPNLLVFEFPGAITNYYSTASMASAGNSVFMIGTQGSEETIYAEEVDPTLATGNWMQFDVVVSRKDVNDTVLLESLAAQEYAIRRPPMNTIKTFLKADSDPAFGSYALGDAGTLVIKDSLYPDGISVPTRLIAWDYKPASNDTVEEVELIFDGDELND